jgi:hypothetical protein
MATRRTQLGQAIEAKKGSLQLKIVRIMSAGIGHDQARGIEAGLEANEAVARQLRLCDEVWRYLQEVRPPGGTDLTKADQIFMVLCYFIWPDATPDNVRCFIFNNTKGDHLYRCEEIIRRLEERKIFQEHPPTDPFPGLTHNNLQNYHYFWNRPLPLGVANVRRSQLIDFDEFGVEFGLDHGPKGHAGRPRVRFRTPELYTRTMKATVLLAVEAGDPHVPDTFRGSVAKPRVWHRIFYQRGVDQVDFSWFVDFVCHDLEENPAPGWPDLQRIFTCGDRESHLTDLVYDTAEFRDSPNRFNIVVRPRFPHISSPAERSICAVYQEVQRRAKRDWTVDTVLENVHRILTGGFGWNGEALNRFVGCGFKDD